MNEVKKVTLNSPGYPKKLKDIPGAPKELHYLSLNWDVLINKTSVAVVGSRKMSSYGKATTENFTRKLSQSDIVIVSGLAFGVDITAHREALENNGPTIAVMPGGLDEIVPETHRHIAKAILKKGGALVSEYPLGTPPLRQNFVARNRIVSGLADAVLITEAAEKSGTLHTANFALEQGREVLAIPGNINSFLSQGTNNLIKAGAQAVTSPGDVLQILGLKGNFTEKSVPPASNEEEYIVLELIGRSVYDAEQLLSESGLDPAKFNQTLTMLEISGKVKPIGGGKWTFV